MKHFISSRLGALLALSLLLCISLKSLAQTSYHCTIKNITAVDSKTIRFDVYIENTGSASIALQSMQAGINFNYSELANGGTITGSFVTGSADTSLPEKQQAPNWKINSTSHQVQLFAAIAIPDTVAANIPSSGGIRLGTFEMKNTADFATGVTPVFAWSFATGSVTGTKTVVTCYLTGNPLGSNITNPESHLIIP